MQCPFNVVIYEWLSSYEIQFFSLWVFIIETWVDVGISSCDNMGRCRYMVM